MDFNSRSFLHRAALPFLSGLAAVLWVGAAQALGLGPIQVSSQLGQPLRATVPVYLSAGESIAQACVRVPPHGVDEDGIPVLADARVALERDGQAGRLVLTTRQAVAEPAVRVALEVGCDFPVARRFTLLLDPPRIDSADTPAEARAAQGRSAAVATAPSPFIEEGIIARDKAEPAKAAPAVRTAKPRRRAAAPSDAARAAQTAATAPRATSAAAPAEARAAKVRKPAAKKTAKPLAARKSAQPASGNRLRLSAEPESTLPPAGSLRMDTALGERTTAPLEPGQQRALEAEQARVRAILRGQDPDAATTAKEAELQKRLAEIGQEMTALRQQLNAASLEMRQARSGSVPWAWLWVVAGIALLAIGAAIWLGLRLRAVRGSAGQPWWANTQMPAHTLSARNGPQTEPRAPPRGNGPNTATASKAVEQAASTSWIDLSRAVPEVHEEEHSTAHGETFGAAVATRPKEAEAALPKRPPPAPAPHPEVLTHPMPPRATVRSNQPWSPRPTSVSARASTTFGGDTPLVIQRAILQSTNIEVQEMHSYPDLIKPPTHTPDQKLDLELELFDEPPPAVPAGLEEQVSMPPLQFSLGPEPTTMESSPPILPDSIGIATARACQHALRLVFKVLSEADVLAEKGEVETAIVLLRKFVYDTEDLPPAPWLLLFNLYKRTDKRPIYEALSARFAKRFGRAMPSWDHAPVGENGPDITHYPALQEAIARDWCSPACMAALYNALMDYTAPDERFFNLPLQRELLNLVNTCSLEES
jgi:hypothetical protein